MSGNENRIILGGFRELEEALWKEIVRLKADDPLAPLTVAVPTGRLVRRLKTEAARLFPDGLMAVRFVHLFRFAVECSGVEPDNHPLLLERIVLRRLRRTHPERRPTYDLAGAVRAAIRDLKDAAVPLDPDLLVGRLREAVDEQIDREYENHITAYDVERFGELLSVAIHHETERERLETVELPDVFRLAAEKVDHDKPVLLYGFYDLTQAQADFLKALASRSPVRFFVPGGSDPAVWRFGDWLRDTFSKIVGAETERLPEAAPLQPTLRNAAGSRDEMHAVAKDVRRLLDEGIPPGEIAVTARSMEEYLPHIVEIFEDHHIPVSGLPPVPLAEHPLARVVQLLFRSSLEDHPREILTEVLLHPLFKAEEDRRGWDLLIRTLRIGRGKDWDRIGAHEKKGYVVTVGREGDEDFRRREIPAGSVKALRLAVGKVLRERRPKAAGWKAMAKAHFALLEFFDGKEMDDEEREVFDLLHAVVGGLARLDVLAEKISPAEFIDAFERELDRAVLPRPSGRGVQVADVMALRGLSFRHLFVAGLNARVFPRFIVEEPFISDAIRRHVIRAIGHHLPVRADGYDEERLLFHLVRCAPTEGLHFSWQRADEAGRLKDPSPLLRPFLKGEEVPVVVPRGLGAKLGEWDLLTPSERILSSPARERWMEIFGRDVDAFRRSRVVMDALKRPGRGEYEGMVGRVPVPERFAPTKLERYASCPFRYFAQDVLRIFPHEEGGEGEDLTPLEIGSLQHLMLELLYRAIDGKDPSPAGLEAAMEKASDEASARFEKKFGIPLRGPAASRRDQAKRRMLAYAKWDVAHRGEWRPVEYEAWAESTIGGVDFHGKIDRVDRGPGGALRVIDYKRKYSAGWKTALEKQAKDARKLQGPVYLEFRKAEKALFDFVENYTLVDPELKTYQATLDQEAWEKVRGEVGRTVATLVKLIGEGVFFIRPSDGEYGVCSFCDFGTVCRKSFPLLRDRAKNHSEEYWAIFSKKR